MAVPVYTGGDVPVPSYHGTLIPEIWSKRWLKAFYERSILTFFCNNDWEGEVKDQGDTVKIRVVPKPTIRDYVKGQKLTTENLQADVVELKVDRAKYFSFHAYLVDKIQSDLDFASAFTESGGIELKVAIEEELFELIHADASEYNIGATAGYKSGNINLGTEAAPLIVDKYNIIDVIGNAATVLDELKVDPTNRSLVLPHWATTLIKTSELKDSGLTGDKQTMIRTGLIGNLFGFEIFATNSVYNEVNDGGVNVFYPVGAQKQAVGFVNQLAKTERITNSDDFGEIIRALNVYDWKTIRPEALVSLCIAKGTSTSHPSTFFPAPTIESAAFVGDDLVFTMSNGTTVTITDAKITLAGTDGVDGVSPTPTVIDADPEAASEDNIGDVVIIGTGWSGGTNIVTAVAGEVYISNGSAWVRLDNEG